MQAAISTAVKHSRRAPFTAALALGAALLTLPDRALATPDPCQSAVDALHALETQQRNAESDFQDDPGSHPAHKPLAAQIARVHARFRPLIAAADVQIDQCRFAHGGKPDQTVNYVATVGLSTTNPFAPGPFPGATTIQMKFLKFDHTRLEIAAFGTIRSAPFSTPLGMNATTVTLLSTVATAAQPSTGMVSATVTLHFAQSVAGASPSDLPITLSTEGPGGSRINPATRAMTLTGTGTFAGGFLVGSMGAVTITGTLSALP